jgi:hypothetical protein
MDEPIGIPRRRIVVFVAAAVLAVGSAVWAVSGVLEREHAGRALTRDRAAVRVWRGAATDATDASNRAHNVATNLAPQLWDVSLTADTVAELDEQELAWLRAALAGLPAASVAAYDRAVSAHNALGSQHDATVEALRTKIDALVAALETLDRAPVATSS